MDFNIFIEPVDYSLFRTKIWPGHKALGQTMLLHNETLPSLEQVKIALIGVKEERGSEDNEGCSLAPDAVRSSLYGLFGHWSTLGIADLGNIRAGFSIDDTYFALSQVVAELLRQNIIPVVIGGSQDLSWAIYQAYQQLSKLVNITAIDPIFDLGTENSSLSSHSWLSHIIMSQPNFLFNYTNIGYQSYLIDQQSLDLMSNLLFDTYRLGNMRAAIEESEPVLRNADMVSFDLTAVRAADAPGNGKAIPNGFAGEEACRIARYAGMSDKLSAIGFFELNPMHDSRGVSADLVAQMIWYFIDGVAHRFSELPGQHTEGFTRYLVKIDGQSEELVFLRSKKSGRWWIDLSMGRLPGSKYEKHHYVPCSEADYQQAMRDELPDRWWQFYQKLM
ncbi:MAG TPA: formimidoylglutamase [Bacteroidales bacterium]|nr:formimidoylglutamase [Bacteroidales bacterium]